MMPTAEEIVQTCHIFIALTIMFGLRLWRFSIPLCVFATVGFALLKEFTWDLIVEGDTLVGSLIDTAWYSLGVLIGWLILWLHLWTFGRSSTPSWPSMDAE